MSEPSVPRRIYRQRQPRGSRASLRQSGVNEVCPNCMSFSRLMKAWSCSANLLNDLVRSGKLETHEHGERTTITRESVAECQWRIAVAKADMEEEEAS